MVSLLLHVEHIFELVEAGDAVRDEVFDCVEVGDVAACCKLSPNLFHEGGTR